MNAHAILSAQGWRGHGHSLHKTDDSIGLSKPLLLSRKDNTKGLGVAQHFDNDQWWLSAFDEQLKGLETTSQGVTQTASTGKLDAFQKGAVGKWSIYTSFVKGGFLEGTVSLLGKDSTSTESNDESDSKDESESKDDDEKPQDKKETKEERRARREAKKERKEERAREKAARRERKKAKAKGLTTSKIDERSDEKRRRREKKQKKRRKRAEESKE